MLFTLVSLFLRYRVIDTNYDDYAVVWGCFESPKYSQILGHTGKQIISLYFE